MATCGGLDSGFVPSVQHFDKKLTEADAYLQILIEQLKLFDDKLRNCKDDERRKKTETLKETTNSMNQLTLLLQIAKDQCNAEKHADGIISTINPVDAIYQPSPLEPVINTMPSQTLDLVLATLGHHQTPTPNSTGSEHSLLSSSLTSPSHVNLSPNTVPEFSYSSSEDEFHDADEFHQSGSFPKHLIDSSGSASVLTHSSSGNSLKHPDTTESLNSFMSNGISDADLFDSHDDRDDEGEAGSVEEHERVIMHLLLFAHPDLFVSISDQKDAGDRMVQVVNWYLSAFHVGRKGSVAKKPYNPILGEIFQELVSEGPAPWVSKNSVTFVAEQVSHHPPISAFYAECFNKKIQFNAHIWTKSKFLGMSTGVYNIGQGCVSCLDHDEHYILTFPNGYGRSILTVPWVELGGECNINCSKTGYSANIISHTKPFYGGKKHGISAEIFSPNDKKGIEWCNVCKILNRGKYLVFIDNKNLPITKKKVRKLEDENEYESRCLWKDVTFNLKSETLMQQLKPSIDLKKDKEQKPEKGRKRKFNGRQGYFMKMENAGFMMNHY
eukprot:bmy_07315T0